MVQRVLIGKFPDGDSSPNGYGLRISKPGYDVKVANPDNEKLVFNSDWAGILAVHLVGQTSVSAGGTATVAHNLGYIPFITGMVNIGNRGWEQYVSINYGARTASRDTYSYYRLVNATTQQYQAVQDDSYDFAPRPQQRYAFEENRDGLDTCKIYADATNLYFNCSSSALCQYLIFRMKAFNAS
jgi:hypothetical protein